MCCTFHHSPCPGLTAVWPSDKQHADEGCELLRGGDISPDKEVGDTYFFFFDPMEISPSANVTLDKGDLGLETAHQKALDCTEFTASNYVEIYPTECWKITLLPSPLFPEEYMPRKKGVGLKDSRAKETAFSGQYSSNKLAHSLEMLPIQICIILVTSGIIYLLIIILTVAI